MKRFFVLPIMGLVLFAFNSTSYAESPCGGIVQFNQDCSNSERGFRYSCCPDGYRAQGIAYNDIKKQDHVDAIGIVCRSISKGNELVAEDFGRTPKKFVCDNAEVFAGIEGKDVLTDGGKFMDTLDGATVFCQRPGSNVLRKIENRDIAQNQREGKEQTVLLPKRIVGIAHKEIGQGSSDRADCVTIITK